MIDWSGSFTALVASLLGGAVGTWLERRRNVAQRRIELELTEGWQRVADTYREATSSALETCKFWRTAAIEAQLALEAKRPAHPKSHEQN